MKAQFNAKQDTQVNAKQDKIYKRNRQNMQKHAAADAIANTKNFKQIISIDEQTASIDPKEVAIYILDNILAIINFKFNYKDKLLMKSEHISKFRYYCAQLLDRQKKLKKHKDFTKHRDHLPMQRFYYKGWLMFTIDTEKNQIEVELVHKYHAEYANPVEDDELEKENKVVNKDKLDIQEINEEFAKALQEYKEGENDINDNIIVEESNET
ncbi:16587_t:CDS:2 [Cetraspora pellucida]|uniref:16587_t:CDS:1 n=1 Tax=Cetraspora pellucida TaxID=1433469 RepID=A0A9N9GQ65_9GLOM|nr:16587_t:CDS:2 [Cetraspora pellucida]